MRTLDDQRTPEMRTVLVTGGTGRLGRAVVDRIRRAGDDVRILSRRPHPDAGRLVGDLRRDAGVVDAVAGAEVIVHCATTNGRGDVAAARHLVAAARQVVESARTAAPHLVFISIVGIDRIPLTYYRAKLAAERVIEDSGLPCTILRATQFHQLIARLCHAHCRLPMLLLPSGFRVQPIDAGEVADRLVELAGGPAAGRVPDMAGPQVLELAELARSWLVATGRRRPVVQIPVPGKIAAGYRQGANLARDRAVGTVTFDQFLARGAAGDW